MTEAAPDSGSPIRKASRDVRRQQLIESTIRVLGQKGYAALTVSDIAKAAGLSSGIVIFHFGSKDGLLADVLRFLAGEYRQNWQAALAAAGPDPAARLKALLHADFDPAIFTPGRLAAWIAFWGETQGRPTYDDICSGPDAERQQATLTLCEALIASDGGGHDPRLVMQAFESMTDGLWFGVAADGAGHKGRVNPEGARQVIDAALRAFFPRHYPPQGI